MVCALSRQGSSSRKTWPSNRTQSLSGSHGEPPRSRCRPSSIGGTCSSSVLSHGCVGVSFAGRSNARGPCEAPPRVSEAQASHHCSCCSGRWRAPCDGNGRCGLLQLCRVRWPCMLQARTYLLALFPVASSSASVFKTTFFCRGILRSRKYDIRSYK